jgi:hypothetical protein
MGQSLSPGYGSIGSRIVRPALRNGTLALVACVCAALVGTEVWRLWQVNETNIRQTEVVTSTTARSIAEQAETAIKTADRSPPAWSSGSRPKERDRKPGRVSIG